MHAMPPMGITATHATACCSCCASLLMPLMSQLACSIPPLPVRVEPLMHPMCHDAAHACPACAHAAHAAHGAAHAPPSGPSCRSHELRLSVGGQPVLTHAGQLVRPATCLCSRRSPPSRRSHGLQVSVGGQPVLVWNGGKQFIFEHLREKQVLMLLLLRGPLLLRGAAAVQLAPAWHVRCCCCRVLVPAA